MSDDIKLTFEGLPQFDAAMAELAGPGFDRASRKALRAGGKIIQEAVTEAAPVRTPLPSGDALPPGALKSDIELHVTKEGDGSFAAYIEPGKYTIRVARWVEEGHAEKRGKKVTGRVEAHPFFRRAFETSVDQAEATALETFNEKIAEEAAKVGMG
jgi:Bacteriophage HK97-gp10, putative tail-component